MIEFLTLFVGLVLGVHNIEVTVSGPVARVEKGLASVWMGSGPWVSSIGSIASDLPVFETMLSGASRPSR